MCMCKREANVVQPVGDFLCISRFVLLGRRFDSCLQGRSQLQGLESRFLAGEGRDHHNRKEDSVGTSVGTEYPWAWTS